jgi:catechol 2,3-dioxygenase-like lactoylglutathione lyase family enzyme
MAMQAAKNAVDLGMIVKDIKASLAFYEDLLGLKKIGELPLWFGTMHRLAFGDSFVKLVDPKEVPPAAALGLTSALGFRYLTFQVTNIDEICADCERAGVPFDVKKNEFMPGVTIAMVRDPDGNVVEFVQRA